MIEKGWRTVIVTSKTNIKSTNENLVIEEGDDVKNIPLANLRVVLIDNLQSSIATYVFSKLAEYHIKLIMCDKRHNPVIETNEFFGNTYSSGKLKLQIDWEDANKKRVWERILQNKISNQAKLLDISGKKNEINHYIYELDDDNSDIIEAQAAEKYFKSLFGNDFRRRTENNINSALNYGYSILLSLTNQIVVEYGYNTSLGINHKNIKNNFNFSCDIMEPFRPFVDQYVFENNGRELDYEYKKELVALQYSDVIYDEKSTELYNAIREFTNDVIKNLNNKSDHIGKVEFSE